jgi:predicted nucleic acid-binding protein
MSRFVLDCSMTMAWYLEDEASDRADAVLASLESQEAVVPSHWPLDIANVLAICERRNRISAARVSQILRLLGGLSISVDEQTARNALGDVLSLARSHPLTACDAAYLELALRIGCPLASLDAELNASATGLGIALFNG